MRYIEMNKSIATLSDSELEQIMKYGHLGVHTNKISELWKFYVAIEEEQKRRELKKKELQKILPIDKYFRCDTIFGGYIFKVIECCNAPEGMHITHYCRIKGYKIVNNELNILETKCVNDFQIEDGLEFGWDAKSQQIIFWDHGSIAPYETIELSQNKYCKIIQLFSTLGFEVDLNDLFK